MKVRELLHIELWSKGTSRKILFGLVVGCSALYVVERYWLTPGERRAGKEALAQIDLLQNPDSVSDQDVDAKVKQAEGKVEAAKQAALTIRDRRVAEALYGYVVMIDMERCSLKMHKLMQQRHVSIKNSDWEFEEKLNSSGKEVTQFLRSTLHKALD